MDALDALHIAPDAHWSTGEGPGSAALSWADVELAGHKIILCRWDFSVSGGTFGVRDASGFCDAVATAVRAHRPVVCWTASGGTRVTEGIAALTGMARVTLARRSLTQAGVPLIAVCDQPTTGGVWVTIGAPADIRCAIQGATVGFAGPRVVEAVSGSLPAGSHTASTAFEHGLVDAVLAESEVGPWLRLVLQTLAGRDTGSGASQGTPVAVDPIDGWEQVQRSRASTRPGGAALLEALLVGPVWLTAPRGDRSVVAAVGRLDGHGCVAVALAAVRSGRPTPDGFRLLVRAAGLAGRWALPLVTFVDSPGAEPGPDSENDGLALAISDAFAAVLACPSPSVGVLTGEGGSGGALSALVCDTLLATPDSYFAALVPEGAAAALRTTPADAARQLALTPAHLLANQVADGIVPVAGDSGFTAAIGAAIAELLPQDPGARLAAREARWAGPLHPAARRA